MNKSLDQLAEELEAEINKVHKMVIDLPEELWIKDQLLDVVKKKYMKRYEEHFADLDDTQPQKFPEYRHFGTGE